MLVYHDGFGETAKLSINKTHGLLVTTDTVSGDTVTMQFRRSDLVKVLEFLTTELSTTEKAGDSL
ncbi:hypothetical protein [Lactiplantibacillus pentosus]|uniref:hypothetical protein n=1 Tax=Lactiplantibacillus pentosus TaxID=1589 RepID=UPI001FD6C970|nr:hypothetical protein [Lactiplantibacillus pentosus]MCJ8184795.1 hypothetical protein [Lactiplantibacillus pentosus]